MPPRNSSIPKYGLHKPTGQARVVLNGRDYYLGKYGSAESRRKYDQLIAAWLSNNQLLPEDSSGPQDLTVAKLLLAHLRFAEGTT